MDASKINDWLQLVGMLGIIASLIFVGLQVNQTQRAGEGAELGSYVETSIHLRELLIENADIWRKACAGEELSAQDQTKAAMLLKAYLEFSSGFWIAARTGITQSNAQYFVNRLAANLHRYPGFAALSNSQSAWAFQGEKAFDVENVRLFSEALRTRLAELKEIEPNPDFDVRWCGL